MTKKWLNIIHNKATPKVATVQILDEIGYDWWSETGTEASEFMSQIRALGDLTDVTLEMNSPGGSVFEGVTIATFISNHPAKWHGLVMGQAASISSVIMCACDTIEMALGTNWCAHKPLSALYRMATATDFRSLANDLDTIEESILAFYLPRIEAAGKTKVELVAYMEEDRYMTATEALEWGFVDSLSVSTKAVAYKSDSDAFNRGASQLMMKAKDGCFIELKSKYEALLLENDKDKEPYPKNLMILNGVVVDIKDPATLDATAISNGINKCLENENFAVIENKFADAGFIAKTCAENGLDYLINSMIEEKYTASKLKEVVAQTLEIKNICTATGIDAAGILKNIQNPVEMLRQGIADAAALSEKDQDSNNSSNFDESKTKMADAKSIYKNRKNSKRG